MGHYANYKVNARAISEAQKLRLTPLACFGTCFPSPGRMRYLKSLCKLWSKRLGTQDAHSAGSVTRRSLSSQLPTDVCALLNSYLRIVHSETLFCRQYGQDSLKFRSVHHPFITTVPESLEASLLLKPQTTPYQNSTVKNGLTSVQNVWDETHQKPLCIRYSTGSLGETEAVC